MWGWLKCNTGFHDFNSWSYSASDKCEQTRSCNRCNKRESQTVHVWPEFAYVSKGSCEQARSCTRCKSEEKRIAPHLWIGWAYTEVGECDQEQKCLRCKTEDYRVKHRWGVWQLEAPNSCVQVRFCRRCSTGRQEKEAEFDSHQWTEPKRVDCGTTVQTCQRCREEHEEMLRFGAELHVYGPWKRVRNGGRSRVCRECGNEDYESA
jgi:hypothetical protein